MTADSGTTRQTGLLNPACATAQPNIKGNRDQRVIALAREISMPFHYSTDTPGCNSAYPNDPCVLCLNAARLCMQALVPKVADEILTKIERTFGRRCDVPHPGGD